LFAVGLAAQNPPEQNQRPTVFRAGATFVSVDVYPRQNGQFLDGLTAGDFQIFEDGKPQRLETFSLIRFAGMPADEERREPAGIADSERQAADPRNRVFVVYLDLYNTTLAGSRNARQPVVDFLNRTIGPTDLFGVLTPEIPVSALVFGRRTETIEAELTKEWFWGQANFGGLMRTPAEQLLQTCGRNQSFGDRLVLRHREDLLLTSLENLVRRLNALRDERMHVVFLSEGWSPHGPAPDLLRELRGRLPSIGLGRGATQANEARRERFCDESIARLAMADFRARFHDLLTAASRANVSFHPVDVGGLKVGLAIADAEFGARRGESTDDVMASAAARDSETRASLNTLRDMAAATDGRPVVQTNDLDGGLRRIADDLRAFYLLGYYSTNPAADGRFREIEVKVARPDVSLTARRGYFAPTEAMVRAAEAARANVSAAAAVPGVVTEALADLARLRSEAALHGVGVRTPAGLTVTIELTSRELTSGRWSKGGEIELTVTGDAGRAAQTHTAPFAASTRALVATLPLDAGDRGPWRVRAQARAGAHLVEQAFQVAPPADAILGDARWFRGAAAASAPLRPAAEPLFRRVERLQLEWAAPASLDSRTARLLDRRGVPLAVDVPVTDVERDGVPHLAVALALAPLAEGDYLIELTATQDGATARRLVAFRVMR
jgi:VWFA-related protein